MGEPTRSAGERARRLGIRGAAARGLGRLAAAWGGLRAGRPDPDAPADPPPTHAVPVFDGRASHSHRRREVAELRREARAIVAGRGPRPDPEVFVQFAGFPRSGHSLVGSVLDAHPDAVVSHELDAMGLLRAGLDLPEILALVEANSRAFEDAGRWWNGYCYAVPGASGGPSDRPLVMGDKKGDWALRHHLAEPGLLDGLRRALGPRRGAWIAVVRNPYDNVATLSLRKGRRYDVLRIGAASDAEFAARVTELQKAEGGIAPRVLPEMVEDYATLCAGLADLEARVGPADWHALRQDRLHADPEAEIARLLRFLGLSEADGFAARAATIVRREPSRTRDAIEWPDEARRAVDALVARHGFLRGFTFDD